MKTIHLNLAAAFCTWVIVFYLMWPRAVEAASFSSDIRGYDFESLAWATLMSLLGGALRTIFTLATDEKVVRSFGVETVKDAVVAVIAGVLAYIVLEAFRSFNLLPVASEVRLAIILFAGWSRMSFFGWLNKLGTRVTESVNDRISTTIGGGGREGREDVGSIRPPVREDAQPTPKPKPFKELDQ